MISVLVLFGGRSSEHEVSCMSVVNVLRSLDNKKYEIHRVGITKEGHWVYVSDTESITNGSWVHGDSAILSPDAKERGLLIIKEGTIKRVAVDVAFPVMHGKNGEDGTIQGLFELSGIPYVGCGVLSSAACMDKITTKIFADKENIRQADYVADIAKDMSQVENTIKEVEDKLGYPVFVKPSNAGSSCGVSKADNADELRAAIALAKQHDTRVLIEENISGHEVECAVLGGYEPKASRIGEILAAAEFYDYDAKYNSEASKTVINPDLPDDVKEKIRKNAVTIFKAVSCFGLSRVDFFVEKDTNEVIFNEINTFPGFTNISMYPKLWEDQGLSGSELVDQLIDLAFKR